MEKNNDAKLVKLVFESYAIRNGDGSERFRVITREGAEKDLNSLREYCERHSRSFDCFITRERAIVECEVVRGRYPKSYDKPEKAGRIFYRLYHDDDLVADIDHQPKPLDLINAYARDIEWTVVE